MATEPAPIAPSRFPRVRTELFLSASLRDWLAAQARAEASREGGRPSMSSVLERVVREYVEK